MPLPQILKKLWSFVIWVTNLLKQTLTHVRMTFGFHMLREIKPALKINLISHMYFHKLKMLSSFTKHVNFWIMLKTFESFFKKHVNSAKRVFYKLNTVQNKCLVIKGVPTNITELEFKEFLYLNKMNYAKAE